MGAWPGPRLGIPAAWPSAQPADYLDRRAGGGEWGGGASLSFLSAVGNECISKERAGSRFLSPFPKPVNNQDAHEGPC